MGGACKSNVVRSAENEGLRQKIEAVQLQIAAANAVNSQPVSVSAASAQELTETLARLAMQNQKLRLQKASNGTEPAGQSGQSRRIGNLRKRAATLKADNAALEQVMQEENGNTDTLPELQAELATRPCGDSNGTWSAASSDRGDVGGHMYRVRGGAGNGRVGAAVWLWVRQQVWTINFRAISTDDGPPRPPLHLDHRTPCLPHTAPVSYE